MRVFFIITFSTCLCFMQGQVWNNVISNVGPNSYSWFASSIVDSTNNILYLGGDFSGVNQHNTNAIIRYDGMVFDTLQSGLDDQDHGGTVVRSMQIFQNKLYVFGTFQKTGKYFCRFIGRWNGISWDSVNFKPRGDIWFSDVYNNELYVAGSFDTIGGIASNCISKYDGNQWYNIGHPVKDNLVTAMKVFKGVPYIAAQITEQSSSANISYYDGAKWVPWVGVSGDVAKYVAGMTVIDSMLYVYGRFNSIAGTNCRGLAAYNGKNWYGFGSGLSNSGWETIKSVKKINGEIYAMGVFNYIEGIGNPTSEPLYTNIAKFDGQKWCLFSPPSDNEINGLIEYNNDVYLFGAIKKMGNDSVLGFLKWNGGNTVTECSQDVGIYMSTVGIRESINKSNMNIYPNPVKDKLKLDFSGFETNKITLQLINSLGQTVCSFDNSIQYKEIDLSNFPAGLYYLKVQDGNKHKVFKILKE
ncbi:hypothetical protein CNR22_20350 [Sphingobacteriaceae bacterium]|nr:hypothetical protein CNR22_20350 [Sphingobacteriaceae bacterium]